MFGKKKKEIQIGQMINDEQNHKSLDHMLDPNLVLAKKETEPYVVSADVYEEKKIECEKEVENLNKKSRTEFVNYDISKKYDVSSLKPKTMIVWNHVETGNESASIATSVVVASNSKKYKVGDKVGIAPRMLVNWLSCAIFRPYEFLKDIRSDRISEGKLISNSRYPRVPFSPYKLQERFLKDFFVRKVNLDYDPDSIFDTRHICSGIAECDSVWENEYRHFWLVDEDDVSLRVKGGK